MRNIKFRVAHYSFTEDNFVYFTHWGYIDNKGRHTKEEFRSPASVTGAYRKTQEQFVGLLDKNGEEIFEGDIVSVDGVVAEVIYSERWAEFKLVGANSVGWYENIEVIGNIHENKSLLL